MDVSYTLELGFNTDLGNVYKIRLKDADPAVTEMRISSGMGIIINSNVIEHKNGELTAINSARLVKTEVLDIDVT